jgi:hypothetical protein
MAQINIQPVFIWVNGVEITATKINANSIFDNLEIESKFYYELQNEDQTLINGNISINGDAYIQWLVNDFSTLWALEYICTQLNLIPILPNN